VDAGPVGERVVLARVTAGDRAVKARPRDPLLVGLPGPPGALELAREIGARDAACRAVARDPVRRAAHERQVVRQRGVADRVAARRGRVAARELGEVWRRPTAEDRAALPL